MQADELELSIERAVPLGLILNEIATNSIKHAFGPDAGGRITVKLVAGVGYGEARLSVADNGRGIKQHNPTGTGLKLIVALARHTTKAKPQMMMPNSFFFREFIIASPPLGMPMNWT